jgi:hypothetical protein
MKSRPAIRAIRPSASSRGRGKSESPIKIVANAKIMTILDARNERDKQLQSIEESRRLV